jgi:hypothetical protein
MAAKLLWSPMLMPSLEAAISLSWLVRTQDPRMPLLSVVDQRKPETDPRQTPFPAQTTPVNSFGKELEVVLALVMRWRYGMSGEGGSLNGRSEALRSRVVLLVRLLSSLLSLAANTVQILHFATLMLYGPPIRLARSLKSICETRLSPSTPFLVWQLPGKPLGQ